MIKVEGNHGIGVIQSNTPDESAIQQINELLNTPLANDANVVVMPDYHSGKGCVVGTTMKIKDKVCPNLVGVDLSCGVLVAKINNKDIDLEKLDRFMRRNIHTGFNIRHTPHSLASNFDPARLTCDVNTKKALKSLGTLGGGNHFISIEVDEQGYKYIIIHTGSRNLGLQVAQYYQNLASETCTVMPKGLEYLTGDDMESYLRDTYTMSNYADLNRTIILTEIIDHLNTPVLETFTTVHNYIDSKLMIRKGAVSAGEGEKFIVPLNSADGSLICRGLGNPDWNYSAPHGAGRVLSRTQAKKTLNMGDFTDKMKNIYSSGVIKSNLDEAPAAYKPADEIKELMLPTADVLCHLKPIYNFKAV